MTTTAAIYTRISRDKTGEAVGVGNQLEACKSFILAKGWTVGEIYSDNDISATSGATRPDFERLLKDAPPVVVYREQTRIERGDDSLDRFLLAGCEGYGADGTRATVENASAELITRLFSILGNFEGKQKSERQKLRYSGDAKAGKVHLSRPVFGNDYKTGKLIPDESKAIQWAAKKLVKGDKTFYGIARDWNAQGFRTPKSKGAGGKEWEAGTVRNFFTRERLIGKRTYGGVTYDLVGWEPILAKETFEQIQTLIQSNRTGKRGVSTSRSDTHLLTGIARCGKCGKGMNIGYRGGKGSPRVYKCTTPNHTSRTANKLEEYVVGMMFPLLGAKGADSILNPNGTPANIAALRAEKAQAELDHAAWLDEATEEGLKPSIIASKEAKHAEKSAVLEARIAEYNRESLFAQLVEDMPTNPDEALSYLNGRWEAASMERRRELVKAIYSKVVVNRAEQGKRFQQEKIELAWTPLGKALFDAFEAEMKDALKLTKTSK